MGSVLSFGEATRPPAPSQAPFVLQCDGEPFEAERFSWAKRVRDVEMDHDGAIWVIEDGPNGRLIKFTKPTE